MRRGGIIESRCGCGGRCGVTGANRSESSHAAKNRLNETAVVRGLLLAFSILANRMCAHHSPHPHQGWHHITARSCSHDVLCEGNQAHRTLRGIMPPGGSETGRRPRSGPGLRDQRSGCPVGRRRHWQTTAVSVNLVPARASTAHWSPSIISTQALASQNRDGRRPSNLPRSEASGFVQPPP